MKKLNLFRVVACAALVLLLAVGCAKKPAADEMTAQAPAGTEMSQPSQMGGAQDGGIQEEAITDGAIAEPQAQPEDKLAITGLERIHFAFDSFVLSEQAKSTLENNARYLKANPGIKVRIEGHCDERGSDSYNLALGEKRARVAEQYLASLGVDGIRMSIISYGEEVPLDPAGTEAAWSKNRRAEFIAF